MKDWPPTPKVDRREFLDGRWSVSKNGQASTTAEVASILVQARPEQLEAVACAIEALPGSKIYSRSNQGKLVVVIEADDVGVIGTTLNTISSMSHVLSAALVFHCTDEA